MPILDDAQRDYVAAYFQRNNAEPTPFSKVELREAVEVMDIFIDERSVELAALLPPPIQAGMTLEQQRLLSAYTHMARNELLAGQPLFPDPPPPAPPEQGATEQGGAL